VLESSNAKLSCVSLELCVLLTRRSLTPEVDGSDLTSLLVSPNSFFLSSLQTLFLLSNPNGKTLAQATAHTTPIHSIRHSPELNTVTTAAVGDRFITVFSTDGTSITRLGSLTCTHDVRSFTTQSDTLFAITVIGTLEVFRAFHAGFEAGRKGGLTKTPHAEVRLKTNHSSKVEVQDIAPRGSYSVISWIEGSKVGFELVDLTSITSVTEINVTTRREQGEPQV
jgi:hypothetical protein